MKVLERKLVRELWHGLGLLLAITSIMAVGVMCFAALQSAYFNLEQARRDYYRQCRMADFWIEAKKVPLAELGALSALSGVTEIRSRIQFSATVDLENVAEPLNGLVLSLPDHRQPVLNDIVLKQGDYFTSGRENEVIVNHAFARAHGLYPGQWIHLLLNNRRQELFIVGTAISSEFTYLLGRGSIVPDPQRFGVFYIKRRYAEDVFDFQGAANQIVGRLAPDVRQRPEDVLRRAESLLDDFGVFTVIPLRRQASNQFLTGEINGLGAFATVVPSIFLAVAALVLNVFVMRLARRQRVVVGTLKALGYTDGQIFRHFLKFGLCVGLAGGLLGDGLGFLAATGMTQVYRRFFEFPELHSRFHVVTHALGLSISLLCAVAGSFYGARSMLLLQAAEAMRPEPPRRGGEIWLERFPGLWQRLDASWRSALRSVFRNRLRTTVGIFAAAMGAGLLVNGFMMTEAQDFLLDFQFQQTSSSDIDLMFKDEQTEVVLDEVRRLPGVDYVEPVLDVACTFIRGPYRRKGAVTGLLDDARLTVPRDRSGRAVRLPTTGLVMSRGLAEILHLTPGQSVTIVPVKGQRRAVEVTVEKVADSFLGLTAYAEIEHLSRLVDEPLAISGAQLLTDGNPQHLDQLYRQLKQLPGVESIQSRRSMIENITRTLLQVQWFFIGMLVVFAGVIFFGSIVNASVVNLAERQREVATFRALGYDPWRIGGIFLRESLLTNTVGTVLGLPIGYLLVMATAASYDNDLIRLPVVTAPWIWIVTLGLSILFALAAHGVVQRTIHRMNYLEALQVKE